MRANPAKRDRGWQHAAEGESEMPRNTTTDTIRTLLVLCAATTQYALFAPPVAAQDGSERTLLKSDLVRMMTGDSYSSEELLQIVRMNCVGFTPSDRDRKDLARLFDGDALLDEIDRCREVGQAEGYRRGVPVARPATSVARPAAPSPDGPDFDAPALTTDGIDPPAIDRPPVGEVEAAAQMPGVTSDSPPRLLNWNYVTSRILTDYRPDRRHSGEVTLRIWVDEQGRAGEAEILDADGDPALAKVALSAVPLMRFAPAESRDRKVGAWATLPIRFKAD
jgi:protein TonB